VALPAGAALTLGIRPEEVLVGPAARSGPNVVATRVGSLQFMGAFVRLHLALPGRGEPNLICDVAMNALAEMGVKEGAELGAALPPAALRAFPPEA
jgi:hypothetical protein